MRLLLLLLCCLPFLLQAQDLYKMPALVKTAWTSFENPTGAKGKGGAENKQAKGHPADIIKPG